MKLCYKVIYISLLCLSLILYAKCHMVYSYPLCIVCMILFAVFFLLYIKIVRLKNFFCFELLFSISFFFVFFVYPVFIYPVNKTRFFTFAYGFDENVITKSTFLALIGYAVFLLGAMNCKTGKKIVIRKYTNKNYIHSVGCLPIIMLLIMLIMNIVKVLVLGYSVYWGARSPRIWGYIDELSHGMFMAAISIKFYYLLHSLKNKSLRCLVCEDKVFWIVITLNITVILYSGGRTEPMCIILALLAGYYTYKSGAKLKTIIVIACLGIIALSTVGVVRMGTSSISFDIFDLTMDLILNNHTLYLGYSYVNKQGYEIFPLINSLLRVVPFLAGTVAKVFTIPNKYTTSAIFFSTLILGDDLSLGLGTNIISSLYLSTGLVGVIIGMCMLGYVVRSISRSGFSSIYKLMIYFELMGNSVYWVRAEYFYPVGHVVVSALMIWMFLKIQFRLVRN